MTIPLTDPFTDPFKKIPLPTVQKWLGHARLETTAIHLEVTGDEERELAKRLWTGG